MSSNQINEAVHVLQQGGVIAYPTEAVYGLGCDPANQQAVQKLLELKQRHRDKGLILIAANFDQLTPFLAEIEDSLKERVLATWPGPVTWLWPARPTVSSLLRGKNDTIAVRVTAHSLAAELCRAFGGAIVSTSANKSGIMPAKSAAEVRATFGRKVNFIVEGAVGNLTKPTQIKDTKTGRVIR